MKVAEIYTKDKDGNISKSNVIKGESAYASAVIGGYQGTEEEFYRDLGKMATTDDVDALNAKITYITPEQFGAKGDGITDDTEALQKAIDTASSNATLKLSEKTYLVSKLQFKSNLVIKGVYGKSVLKTVETNKVDDYIALANNAKNINIEDVVFHGSETFGNDQAGISLFDIKSTNNVHIYRCIFRNNKYASIRLNNAHYLDITDCNFEATDVGVMAFSKNPSTYVNITNCSFNGKSSFNSFENTKSEQISIYNSEGVSKHWNISNCKIANKTTNVICIGYENDAEDEILASDIQISNITVENCVGAFALKKAKDVHLSNITILDGDNTIDTQRIIGIVASNNVTLENVVSYRTLLSAINIDANSTNNKLSNIKYKIADNNGNADTIAKINGDNNTLSNIYVLNETETNLYAVVGGNSNFVNIVNSGTTSNIGIKVSVSGKNNIKIDTRKVRINRTYATNSDVTTNIYLTDTPRTVTRDGLSNMFVDCVDTKYIVTAYSNDNVTKLADTRNFKLMRNGFEFEIEWKNIQYITDGKTFTPKNYSDGNIVWLSTDPIPLKKTNTIISRFKQIDGKWYEIARHKSNDALSDIKEDLEQLKKQLGDMTSAESVSL